MTSNISDRTFFVNNQETVRLQPSAELLAQAVSAGQLAIAKNILQSFPSEKERREALQFRNCHHGTPLGSAVELGDVPMTELILGYLTDEDAAFGNQGSLIDPMREGNAAVIALSNCAFKRRYPDHSNYPCQAMLDVLRKRDVFQILR